MHVPESNMYSVEIRMLPSGTRLVAGVGVALGLAQTMAEGGE